jgi:nitroimidazol reductase NimA-like FMN-containing flavoprotein (pyridoxamine 5'-phosphate oxidase superfamily)
MSDILKRESIVSMLQSHDFGVLATYGGEHPYTSLVTINLSRDGRSLHFPTLRQTQKYANIIHEARVSVLLDTRDRVASDPGNVYALTVIGTACEITQPALSEARNDSLNRHPNLRDFLSQPQTALIAVTPIKIILVRRFQEVQHFDWTEG